MIFLLAGLMLGLAQTVEPLALLAWPGVAVLAFALSRAQRPAQKLRGILLFALVYDILCFHWLYSPILVYLRASKGQAVGMVAVVVLLMVLLLQGPIWLASFLSRYLPVALWLPLGWAAGEALLEWTIEYSIVQLLYSQWQVEPVLRALRLFGWFPTLLLGLFAAASFGAALEQRRIRLLIPGVLVAAAFLVLPPREPATTEGLEGIGVVHMADIDHPPAMLPPLDLLIWPEGASRLKLRLEEGEQPPGLRALPGLPGSVRMGHLLDLVTKTHRGYLNAAVLTNSSGSPVAVRGKSVLVPAAERSFLGMRPEGGGFVEGRGLPIVQAGSRRIIVVICYEAFSRSTVARGRAAGGELLAILSSDRALIDAPHLLRRSIGAAVLRSVEYGVPVVRAAMWGSSAIVLPDGRVVTSSRPGTSGVLFASDRTAW